MRFFIAILALAALATPQQKAKPTTVQAGDAAPSAQAAPLPVRVDFSLNKNSAVWTVTVTNPHPRALRCAVSWVGETYLPLPANEPAPARPATQKDSGTLDVNVPAANGPGATGVATARLTYVARIQSHKYRCQPQ